MIERQMAQIEQEMAMLLSPYQGVVQRLAEVPGLGVDSAQQIVADVGIDAATFPSAKKLAFWDSRSRSISGVRFAAIHGIKFVADARCYRLLTLIAES